jgi:hypothetical protein
MSLFVIHSGLARASVIFSAIIGLYGLWRYFRKQGISQDYWGVLAMGELLYLGQALMGVLLLGSGLQAGRWAHYLYGVLAVITLPGTFAYTRGQDGRREALLYGLVGLFMVGVSLRAIGTVR